MFLDEILFLAISDFYYLVFNLRKILFAVELLSVEDGNKTLIFTITKSNSTMSLIKPKKSDFVVDDEFIRRWMSSDEIFRGRHGRGVGWPVLEGEDLMAMIVLFRSASFKVEKPMCGKFNYMPDSARKDDKFVHLETDPEECWKKQDSTAIVDQILMLGRGHLIVAGGSVARVFYHDSSHISDYDFFFIGLNPDETAKAEDILHDVIRFLHKEHARIVEDEGLDKNDIKGTGHFVTWNEKAVTVKIGGPLMIYPPYQFILRLYPDVGNHKMNVSLPIGGFDLHSCAVARALNENGKFQFYGTPAGAFALGGTINILMTSRMSTSMIPRLSKYRNRGFDIYFPGTTKARLSERSTSNHTICSTADNHDYMTIVLPNITVNMDSWKIIDPIARTVHESDYEASVYEWKGQIVNLKSLISGRGELYARWANDPSEFRDIISSDPSFFDLTGAFARFRESIRNNHGAHRNTLRTLSKGFVEYAWYFGKVFRDVIRIDVIKTDKIYLEHLNRVRLFEELAQRDPRLVPELELARRNTSIALKQAIGRQIVRFAWLRDEDFDNQLDIYMERMVAVAVETQSKIANHKGLQWNTKNPLTQLTASNNPTVENARSWWGSENYVPFLVGFPDEIYWLAKQICILFYGATMGKSLFKDLLLPYFVRVWATGIVEDTLIIARKRRGENRALLNAIPDPSYPIRLPNLGDRLVGMRGDMTSEENDSGVIGRLMGRFPTDWKDDEEDSSYEDSLLSDDD